MVLVLFYYWGRPLPIEMREEYYPCVVYYRKVHWAPNLMIAHILTVDLTCKQVEMFATPPDRPRGDAQLDARKTSEFVNQYELTFAVNGDAFHPWHSDFPFDFYPHALDDVQPYGISASQGEMYGGDLGIPLYFSDKDEASFERPIRKVYNAISGTNWLIHYGILNPDLNDRTLAPRTAVGLDSGGTKLIIVVVDGRQPFYSNGATIQETAELMQLYGGENAILMDGGGSSTLVIRDPKTGKAKVMNSPIDLGVPGRERYIANHLGGWIRPSEGD